MYDFVQFASAALGSAVSAATAKTVVTITPDNPLKSLQVDNALDVAMVVMVDGSKPFLVRASATRVFDLSSNNSAVAATGNNRVVKTYAQGGMAPGSGDILFDGMA